MFNVILSIFHEFLLQEPPAAASGAPRHWGLLRRRTRPHRAWQSGTATTAAALAVTLPATGLIVAVVLAMWRGLSGRMDEQGSRIDEHGRHRDTIESQQGEILRALGRIEGPLRIPTESTAGAA